MAEILFVSHRIPYPPNKGDKIRASQMIHNLKKLGHKISCAFPIEEQSDYSSVQQLKNICDRLIYPETLKSSYTKYCHGVKALLCDVPLTKGLGFSEDLYNKLKSDTMNYDIVIFFSSISYYYKNAINHKISICDFVDMDSYKWKEYANSSTFPMSFIYNREANLMADIERMIANNVHQSLFVTNNEKNLFLSENTSVSFDSIIDSLECSVDTARFNPIFNYFNPFMAQHHSNMNFVMTGAMDYRPNYDGALFFINEILPYLQQKTDGKVGFYCVGRTPITKLKKYHNPDKNIVITGSVDDVRPYISHSFACIAPLFIGRGIQNKVLEAMASGKTCFVSPNAFDGIDAVDNQHLIVCNSTQEWQEKLLKAIHNPQTLDAIGQAATDCVTHRYNDSVVREKLNVILNNLIQSQGFNI